MSIKTFFQRIWLALTDPFLYRELKDDYLFDDDEREIQKLIGGQ
jgi:hypothetical protein